MAPLTSIARTHPNLQFYSHLCDRLMTLVPPLAWAGSLSDSVTMVSVPNSACLPCLGIRIKRASAAQPTIPLTETQRGTGIFQGPPNTGPAVLQFHSFQAPKTLSALSRRGRAQPHVRMETDTTGSQTPRGISDYRHQPPLGRDGET